MQNKDKHTLRELTRQVSELAAQPFNIERRNRARDINDLKPSRPIVWLAEVPWHEMNIDNALTLVCEDEAARAMEWHFRVQLYTRKYIDADHIYDGVYYIPKKVSSTGTGLEISENTIVGDEKNNIFSHYYLDQLDSFEKVAAIKTPKLTAHPEDDAQRVSWAQEILDGILPVKLRGQNCFNAPWDRIPRFRGVTTVMEDLYDNPELLHATIKRFTENALDNMLQMEALNLYDPTPHEIHCTPAFVSDLPGTEPALLKNIWYRGMAQMFGDVSPKMWNEFELEYAKPLMERCGLVYYGCCEALERKIPLLKTIPNMRKIGVSPWANAQSCAEQIGTSYVFAHKPNPAHVSDSFPEDTVREEITAIIKTCQEHNCAFEFVLKDISTVSYKPENLVNWVKTVMRTIDEFYC